jgi:hypothetical protein
MSSFNQNLTVANFTCRFENKFVMLDLYDEIIFPAFMAKTKRKYGDSTYFLNNVTLFKFGSTELAIAGRLIKDTILAREQLYVDGDIVVDPKSLQSSPSSFFVLRLTNHKLYYVKENKGAPALEQFATTINHFLNDVYEKWMREKYDDINKTRRVRTWGDLRMEFPPPKLELTPMANEGSVMGLIAKFRTINSVEVHLRNTNHELDNSKIFGDMRRLKDGIGADDIALKTKKDGDVGLDKAGVSSLVAQQATTGNSTLKVTGQSLAGDKMTADNDKMKVSIPIQTLSKDIKLATETVWGKVAEQTSLGVLAFKEGGELALTKVRSIVNRTKWS